MATNAAPEPAPPAANPRKCARPAPRKLSEDLASLEAKSAQRPVTLREVIYTLRGRAYTLLLILLIAAGLLERDGLFIATGHAVFAAGVGFFVVLGEIAVRLFDAFRQWLAG